MRTSFWGTAAAAIASLMLLTAMPAAAESTVRVAWCSRTINAAATPWAIATKLGWYAKAGFKLQLIPLAGSTDCLKALATKDVNYAFPSIEPMPALVAQGVKMRYFYTAYQGNIYGFAVPADSPIHTAGDLKGKRIGVASMASAGVMIARAVAASSGLDPEKDIQIMVVGEGAQAAALLRSKQVDALSHYDTQYVLIEQAGMPTRRLDTKDIQRFPSNGIVGLDDDLQKKRAEAVAVAQGYAKGTVFALANPEAAVRILWEVFPQTRGTGRDEATALADDVKLLKARAWSWTFRDGVDKWGESSVANYDAYLDFLVKQGVLKEKPDATTLVTNDLVADINAFDPKQVEGEAKAYK